ncbi:phage tail protein [Sandarakinorhabdus sp. DWP1-3-1]|uniref:phage tail protein n=1 Tax=Sandarakinorhabdus sp. DWP1-3-1 TaxID=2804627 RepID=UPI003CF9DE04
MTSEGPFGTGNFSVEIAAGEAGDPAIGGGFASVGFPDFGVEGIAQPLVLRRAVTGRRDLYAWWDKARAGGKAARDVKVLLLGATREPVMVWTFKAARPVMLSHTPLDANAPALMLETLALAYERMDLDYPADPQPKPGRVIR